MTAQNTLLLNNIQMLRAIVALLVVLPLLGLIGIVSFCVIFSLIYYQEIEKPIYKKAISYGKIS